MKIFSGAAVTFPGIEPVTPAPLLISGLTNTQLQDAFHVFAGYLRGRALVDSLSKAMFDNVVGLIVDSFDNLVPSGQSLYQILISKYNDIEGGHDAKKLYAFHLYLYVTLYHFAVWYCHNRLTEQGPSNTLVLNDTIRNYVQSAIQPKYYSGNISIAPEFFATPQFEDAFAIDSALLEMLGWSNTVRGALGGLRTTNAAHDFVYLLKSGRKLKQSEAKDGKKARREIAEDFRSTLAALINDDVKKFLVSLAANSSPTGDTLLRCFGKFRQYGVGDGSGTVAMFGEADYGLLFFDYELVDIDDANNLCAANRKSLPLFDGRDTKETAACFLYYGLDNTFPITGIVEPQVEFHQYCDGQEMSAGAAGYVLSALSHNQHLLSGMGGMGSDIRPGDFGQQPDAVNFELRSSSLIDPKDPRFQSPNDPFGPEEMVFVVFKNTIVSPRRQPSAATIELKAQWLLLDNKFRKTSAEIQTQIFAGQDQQLSALVVALAADPAFEVFAAIEGIGIGHRLDKARPDTGGLEVERNDDQTDKPPPGIPAYDGLRYAHGRLRWAPDNSKTNGWLLFNVVASVSPLRCTWEGSLTPTSALNSDIRPYVPQFLVPSDNTLHPSYNCVLSSFRAFAMFEAMIEKILTVTTSSQDIDATAKANIANTLNTYLANKARVKVLLPSGRIMTKKVASSGNGTIDEEISFDQAFIDQFV